MTEPVINNETWKEYEYDGKNVKIRKTDGYVNATQLCKAGEREFKKWNEMKASKEFMKELVNRINLTRSDLIQTVNDKEIRSTWVHPIVATNIAQWISPSFGVSISVWIEEWKNYSFKNKNTYYEELERLKPCKNLQLEREIQRKLQKQLSAEIEVETPVGYVDLLTDTEIIEIKEITNWKSALGQILSYGSFYPEHKKYLYLFNKSESDVDTRQVENICKKYQVEVRYNN